jgi:hypothetical protein
MRIAFAAAALACMIGAAEALDEADRSAIRGVIEGQLNAFQRDDAAGAYAHAAPPIQNLFPNEDRFLAMVRESYKPVYRPRAHAFADLKETSLGLGQSVEIKDAEGVDWIALYTVERQPDGTWKITGCYLTKAPGNAV